VAVKKLAVYGKPSESSFILPTSVKSPVTSKTLRKREIYTTGGAKVKNFTVPACYIVKEEMTDGTTQIIKEIIK